MRVLLLTQWYPPEPVNILTELAESLQHSGCKVTVLTGFPNYPSGKIYAGYKQRLFKKERLGEIDIIRVPLYPNHGKSALKRILNYLSFALTAAFIGIWVIPRVDVIHVYFPPLTVGFAARFLSLLLRVPFTCEIQDMWPETLRATGMVNSERALALVGWFGKYVYRHAATIRVISQGFRENLIEKGVPPEKIQVISNWVDTNAYRPVPPDAALAQSLGLAGRFNVTFAGTIGLAQDLTSVIEAAKLVDDLPNIQFVFIGDGVDLPRVQEAAAERGAKNVIFLGRRPSQEMPSLYALSDVLLVHLRNDPLFRMTIPHKVFAYMASGKPILVAVGGESTDIVMNAACGVAAEPGDSASLAAAVRKLYSLSNVQLQRMGENGRHAACESFSRVAITSGIARMLWDVFGRSSKCRETGTEYLPTEGSRPLTVASYKSTAEN